MNTPDMLMMAVALLVAIAIAGGLYTHRLGLSHLLIFLAVGMLAGVDGPLGIPFDDFKLAVDVGSLSLALILLDGGLRTRWREVRASVLPAGLLATAGVLLTSAVVGVLAHVLLDLPWLQGWLMGAAIASTDASAVFAQFTASRLNLPPGLAATIEVESALNDPMAMVLTLAGLDGAWRFIDAAFVVVLLSMLLQGPSLAWLARRLGLDQPDRTSASAVGGDPHADAVPAAPDGARRPPTSPQA